MVRRGLASFVPTALALVAFGLASPGAAAEGRFTIRLYGGPSLFSGGDVNGARGMAEYYNSMLEDGGFAIDGEFHPAHFGPEAGADFIYRVAKTVGFGIGIGYLNASRESPFTMSRGSLNFTQIARAAYGSIPLRLGVFLAIPVSAKTSIALSAGPELHLARASTYWEYAEDYNQYIRMENDVTGTGFGFFGSAALELKLSDSIGLLLEIAGRYARFGGLTGTIVVEDAADSESTSGTLYLLEIPVGPGFPFLIVTESKPGGATEAKLDLSGGSVRFGIVIHL